MTTHLTRIALGTVALFFVCVIAGAAMLTNKSQDLSQDDPQAQDANDSAREGVATGRSNRAFGESELIKDIPYFNGQSSEEETLQCFGLSNKRAAKRKPVSLSSR